MGGMGEECLEGLGGLEVAHANEVWGPRALAPIRAEQPILTARGRRHEVMLGADCLLQSRIARLDRTVEVEEHHVSDAHGAAVTCDDGDTGALSSDDPDDLSSAMLVTPSSAIALRTSAANRSMTRSTPGCPAAPSPYR